MFFGGRLKGMPPKLVSDDGQQHRDPPAGLRGRDRPRALGRAPAVPDHPVHAVRQPGQPAARADQADAARLGAPATRAARQHVHRDGQRRALAPDGPEPLSRSRRSKPPAWPTAAATGRSTTTTTPARRRRRRRAVDRRAGSCATDARSHEEATMFDDRAWRCWRRRAARRLRRRHRSTATCPATASGPPAARPAATSSSACRRSRRRPSEQQRLEEAARRRSRRPASAAAGATAADVLRAGRRARTAQRPPLYADPFWRPGWFGYGFARALARRRLGLRARLGLRRWLQPRRLRARGGAADPRPRSGQPLYETRASNDGARRPDDSAAAARCSRPR